MTIIEDHDSGEAQVNAALELVVGDAAQVDYLKITRARALHVASLLACVGAKAQFNTFAFTSDVAVARNQNFIRFAGAGTKAGIGGVTLLRGKQHADTTLLIEHAAGHCESREQFKTVLDDEAHGVFQGKIVVKPHAQKTDAKMMTRALLLSDERRGRQQAGTGNLRRRRGLRPWRNHVGAQRGAQVLFDVARHSGEGRRGAADPGVYRRDHRGDRA